MGKQELQISIAEEIAEGIYSNFLIISHTDSEFILDFAKLLPGLPKAKVNSRIILSPKHVKLMQESIEDNIKKYESKFGKIKIDKQERNGIGIKLPDSSNKKK